MSYIKPRRLELGEREYDPNSVRTEVPSNDIDSFEERPNGPLDI